MFSGIDRGTLMNAIKKRDLGSGLFFLGIGAGFVLASFRYTMWDRYGPGPGFFPLVLGVLFSGLSLLLLAATMLRNVKADDEITASDTLKLSVIGRTVAYVALLFCFYLFFNGLGFLLTILLFMIGTLLLLGKRSLTFTLSLSILSSVMVYLVFVRLLGVPLPGGILQHVLRLY